MAIFVALIFQVLFVFFAMSINVALIVHDKINLQNSVDLAAYYAAQRQAEVLNAIAHQNYQIRQGWKLLTWRSRVLGSQGYEQPELHPTRSGQISEAQIYRGAGLGTSVDAVNQPAVCIGYGPTFTDINQEQSLCKNKEAQRIEKFDVVPVVAPWLPIAVILNQQSILRRQQFDSSCSSQGIWNWWYTHAVMQSFRLDQGNRRKVIDALANNLSGDGNGSFIDLNGQSALEGVTKVINKNLTYSNTATAEPQIEMFNSFAGLSAGQWLKPIFTQPNIRYMDQFSTSSACDSEIKPYQEDPVSPSGSAGDDLDFINNELRLNDIKALATATFPINQVGAEGYYLQMALGLEKNPWYMGYVGVKATTQSRQIFHPFGDPITITAKAFAKPFGGSIGPTFGRVWPNSSEISTGDPIDALVGSRFTGATPSLNDYTRLPNYSKYPGDEVGLASQLAQGALTNGANNSFNSFGGQRRQYFFSYNDYEVNGLNDPLPWDYDANQVSPSREFELAAISPDLFDISYYSIDPDYWVNYGSRIQANKAALNIPADVPVRGDLGSRGSEMRSIRDQFNAGNKYHRPEAFYFVRDMAHLLTSWVQQDSVLEYTAEPTETSFGKCLDAEPYFERAADGSIPPVRGGCVAGGRSGYSVKIVSEDFLRSSELELGGIGQSGAILNQPPAGF